MTTAKDRRNCSFTINKENIEKVTTLRYLGAMINTEEAKIQTRIQKAAQFFGKKGVQQKIIMKPWYLTTFGKL